MDGPESAFVMHIAKDHAQNGLNNKAPLFRGVRTGRYTYAVASDGAWCLYDDVEDPYQMRNLLVDGRGAKTAGELDGLVFEWLKKAGDPYPYEELRKRRSPLCRA